MTIHFCDEDFTTSPSTRSDRVGHAHRSFFCRTASSLLGLLHCPVDGELSDADGGLGTEARLGGFREALEPHDLQEGVQLVEIHITCRPPRPLSSASEKPKYESEE